VTASSSLVWVGLGVSMFYYGYGLSSNPATSTVVSSGSPLNTYIASAGNLYISTDGINYTLLPNANVGGNGIAYNNGVWLSSNKRKSTDGGYTWTTVSFGSFVSPLGSSITSDGERFIYSQYIVSPSYQSEIIISTDAITFTSLGTTIFSGELVGRIHTSDEGAQSKYIISTANASNIAKCYYSTNLTTFTLFESVSIYANPSQEFRYFNNYWVSLVTEIRYSANGTSWTGT